MKNHKKSLPRKLLAYILAVAMVFSVFVSAAISVNAADEYNLVWSDEFDGNGVNPYNWSLDTGVRNGERQTYTLDNATTQNGKLIIKGECTVVDENGNVMPDGQVSNYTKDVKSASLQSVGKQAFKFGKVEIRAKLPNACSAWPAFWTCGFDKYGMDVGQGGSNWPCNGEIDFMEMMCVNSDNEPKSPWGKQNTDKSYEAHLHTGPKYIKDTGEYYDGYASGTRGYSDFAIDPGGVSDSQQLAAKWHTYGMIWEKNSIKITFDGVVKFTVDTSNEALLKKAEGKAYYDAYKFMLENYGNPFNDYEHYFLLNLAIGGGGTEYRFYNDEWPQNLAIDYIRVYQKNDGVSTHNATITAGTKYTVNGKTYTTYNHWAGKGLLKGSEIASNWVADPKYGGKQVTESDTLPTDKPASSTSTSSTSTTTTTTQKPTSGVTIDFDNVTAELEKVGGIAANNASSDSTSINSGKSFKTYAWTGSVSDFTTYYAALNISPHIAENANSLSFKSVAAHDSTGTALAQYGLTIDGKNYWSGSKASDTNGVINSTVQTISVVGKTLYATDGTSKTINASDIPNITKFLVKPTTTESKIYVDDIVIGVGGSSTSSSSGSSGETLNGDVILDWSNFNGSSGGKFDLTKDDPTGYIHVTGTQTLGSGTQIADLINWWGFTAAGYDKIKFIAYTGSGSSNIRMGYGGNVETANTTISTTPTVVTYDVASTASGDVKFQLDAGTKGATVTVDIYISDIYGVKAGSSSGSGDSGATSYKVTIDGTEVAYSGTEFTFPVSTATNFIAYTDGTNYYDANAKISVTSNKAFTTVALGTFKMLEGASVRLGNVSGIRFYTSIDKDKINSIRSMGTIQLGTLIAPLDFLTGARLEFGLDTDKYVDVEYNAPSFYTEARTGFEGLVGSLINIRDKNITREFVGRGYAVVTVGSITKVIYADYYNNDIANNARSIAYIANAFQKTSDYETISSDLKSLIDKWAAEYVAEGTDGIDMSTVEIVGDAIAVAENGVVKIGMNQWDSDLTVGNCVKFNVNGLTEGAISAYVGPGAGWEGHKDKGAHYGVEIGGVIYWDTPYDSGEIRAETSTDYTFTGKNMYSLVDNSLSGSGTYDVERRITAEDLANITAVYIRPGNHQNAQYVYVESIK